MAAVITPLNKCSHLGPCSRSSLNLVAVTDPGLGGISHGCRYLFSLLDRLLVIPLLFEESHFFNKLQRAHILKQVMNFFVVCLFQVRVFFVGGVKFLFVFIVKLRSFVFILFIFSLEIFLKFLLGFTHLLLKIIDCFLESFFPFFVVGFNNSLNALCGFGQILCG